MNIGIVTVRGPDYHPNRRLLEAAGTRGHAATLIHPYQSWPAVVDGGLQVRGDPLAVDMLLPRQGAEIGDSSLSLLEQAALSGVTVVNGPEAVRTASSKYRTCRALALAGVPVPETVLVNTPDAAAKASEAVGGYPVVAKPPSGRQGRGVFLASDEEALRGYLAEAADLQRGIVIQRFIGPEKRRDLRILVLGAGAAGAMAMKPQGGDFRSNFHLTGESAPTRLERPIETLATAAAAAVGLQIAGVDLVIDAAGRPWILEVNYAPGFRGLEAATGLDIARAIIEHLEKLASEHDPA